MARVERSQRVIGQIHRAILEDVALDAAEDADAQARAVDLAHAAGELHDTLFIQIGRAAGRGRGEISVGGGSLKKKKERMSREWCRWRRWEARRGRWRVYGGGE